MRDIIWKDKLMSQKAKMKWLNEGDVNLGFYHNWINKCSKSRGIESLMVDGRWTKSVSEVKEVVARYFQKQFQARKFTRPQLSDTLFEKRLSTEQRAALDEKFSEEEVKAAV